MNSNPPANRWGQLCVSKTSRIRSRPASTDGRSLRHYFPRPSDKARRLRGTNG